MKLNFAKLLIKLSTISIVLFSVNLCAQSKNKAPLDSLNIVSKIDYIINNSNKYQEFKVVKKTWLLELKSQISDSLKVVSNESANAKTQIHNQQKEIETLKAKIEETNSFLKSATSEKDLISLMGMPLQKGTYNGIMFSTIITLLLLLSVYIVRFRSSNKSTVETKKNYGILDDEFEKFKKNTLEKEQKLKRQLQDEINKNNRLTNNN